MEKPLRERNKIFQSFKKEGMRLENIKRLGNNTPNFLRERIVRKCGTMLFERIKSRVKKKSDSLKGQYLQKLGSQLTEELDDMSDVN